MAASRIDTLADITPEEQVRAAELFEQWRPWLEFAARDQAIKESRGFSVMTAGELLAEPETPAFLRRRAETAYRRGYYHGFSEAMDNLIQAGTKRSAAWVRVAQFFDGPLKRWRYSTRPKFLEFPPNFDPRKENETA